MEEQKPSKQKYKYFGAILNAPIESPSVVETLRGYEEKLHSMMSDFVFLATIIHDRDFYDNGEAKITHLHAFFELPNTETQGQAITRLEKALNVNREQISMQGSNSDILLVQYLTHQNHPEKAKYPAEAIKTTNKERLLDTLAKEYQKPVSESDIILNAVIDSKSALELAQKLGIEKANKYRGYFNQVKEEQRNNIKGLIDENTSLKEALSHTANLLIKLVDNHARGSLLDRDWEESELWREWFEEYWKPYL